MPLEGIVQKLGTFQERYFRFNIYRCHLAYFVITIIICSVVLYRSNTGSVSQPENYGMRYIDALFLATSALTTTGLSTINLNSLNGYQQSVLFLLMLIGDLSTVSISIVLLRRWFFRRALGKKVEESSVAKKIVADIDAEQGLQRRNIYRPRATSIPLTSTNSSRYTEEPDDILAHYRHRGGITAPWETSIWNSTSMRSLEA